MNATEGNRYLILFEEGNNKGGSVKLEVDNNNKRIIVDSTFATKLTIDNIDSMIQFLESAKAEMEGGE